MKPQFKVNFSENKDIAKIKGELLDFETLDGKLFHGAIHSAPDSSEGYDKIDVSMLLGDEEIHRFKLCIHSNFLGLVDRLEETVQFYLSERGEKFCEQIHKKDPKEILTHYQRILKLIEE